jgi:two-component system LytT family response regulator
MVASPPIRALIVDDEPLARRNLILLLKRDPSIVVVGECGSGAGAITSIRQLEPDLVFLDVQMPECDGFDVLEMLGAELPPAVVFVTAHDEYALRAFDAGALDYLLKPFDDARFNLALERARERIAHRAAAQSRTTPRIAIKRAGQVIFLDHAEIDWIEAADYYACIHIGQQSHLLRRSLAELEQDLDAAVFCRIHRSTIVNLNRVRALALGPEGEHEVLLDSNVRLRTSRRFRTALQERLKI